MNHRQYSKTQNPQKKKHCKKRAHKNLFLYRSPQGHPCIDPHRATPVSIPTGPPLYRSPLGHPCRSPPGHPCRSPPGHPCIDPHRATPVDPHRATPVDPHRATPVSIPTGPPLYRSPPGHPCKINYFVKKRDAEA